MVVGPPCGSLPRGGLRHRLAHVASSSIISFASPRFTHRFARSVGLTLNRRPSQDLRGFVSVTNDGRQSSGRDCQTAWMRRTSERRSVSVHPNPKRRTLAFLREAWPSMLASTPGADRSHLPPRREGPPSPSEKVNSRILQACSVFLHSCCSSFHNLHGRMIAQRFIVGEKKESSSTIRKAKLGG